MEFLPADAESLEVALGGFLLGLDQNLVVLGEATEAGVASPMMVRVGLTPEDCL